MQYWVWVAAKIKVKDCFVISGASEEEAKVKAIKRAEQFYRDRNSPCPIEIELEVSRMRIRCEEESDVD